MIFQNFGIDVLTISQLHFSSCLNSYTSLLLTFICSFLYHITWNLHLLHRGLVVLNSFSPFIKNRTSTAIFFYFVGFSKILTICGIHILTIYQLYFVLLLSFKNAFLDKSAFNLFYTTSLWIFHALIISHHFIKKTFFFLFFLYKKPYNILS